MTAMTDPTPETVLDWDGAEAALAQALPGYESRTEQQNLARAIQEAMSEGAHLAAQAGTGTGKSFAAAIPAIIQSLRTGHSVVIATGTKVLQGQYSLTDIPFLVEKLESYFGQKIAYADLKGRSNYLCMSKVADGPDVPYLQALLDEIKADPEHSGDLERFAVDVAGRDRPKLASTSEECPGAASCPFGPECFAVRASNRAHQAQLVITNHAMLATDLIVSTEDPDGRPSPVLLPDYDVVVVDEAQDFEGYMTNALGARMVEATFFSLAVEVERFTGRDGLGRRVTGMAQRLFADLSRLVPPKGESTARLTEKVLEPQRELLNELLDEIGAMLSEVNAVEIPTEEKKAAARQKRLVSRITSLLNKLSILSPWEEDEDTDVPPEDGVQGAKSHRESIGEVVRWVSRDGDKTEIGYSPLSVAGFLAHKLWSHRTGVLLSATLANGNDFSYIPHLLGMRDYRSFDAGTPFDYENQAALWIPEGHDWHPTKDRSSWLGMGHQTTLRLIQAAGGRALLLFTSRSAMNQRWDAISEELEELDIPCYRQEAGTSTDWLMARKREQPTSVVFGLKSLMQGVSVEGEALQLVILDKMPFPVPSEVVFQARAEARDAWVMAHKHIPAEKAKWDRDGAFFGLSVPEMMLVLLQAFGRLIRTKRDRGLMVVLDSRLSARSGPGYGKSANRALPPARRLGTEREAVTYLRGLA